MVGVCARDFVEADRLLSAAQSALSELQSRFPASRWTEPTDAEEFRQIRRLVLDFEDHCRELGAKSSADCARRTAGAFTTDLSLQMAGTLVEVLENALNNELSGWHALVLGRDQAERLEVGGKGLSSLADIPRLAGISVDLEEASRCQAVGRATATMFHLMRVMEVVLSAWANYYGVARTRFRENRGQIRDMKWVEICAEFTDVVRTLPPNTQTEAIREAQQRALRLLSGFAAAWQSPTLMPAAEYSPMHSEHAFCLTLDLLRLLATFIQG